MRTPGGRRQQLYLLRHNERSKASRETLHEILVGEDAGPMLATVDVIVEFPQMHELVNHARIALKVTDQLFVMSPFLQGGEAKLLIELDRFRHFSDVERVGPQFVEGHPFTPLPIKQCLWACGASPW